MAQRGRLWEEQLEEGASWGEGLGGEEAYLGGGILG